MKNYYKILGVSENASDVQIKDAYIKLIEKYQPDKFSGEAKKLVIERIEDIKEAYSVLSDDFLRSQFDKEAGIETKIKFDIPDRKESKAKKTQKNNNQEKTSYKPNKNREDFYNQERYDEYDENDEYEDYGKKKKKKIKKKPEVGSTADLVEISRLVFERLKSLELDKPTKKGVLAMVAAIGIVVLLWLILWLIPFTREFAQSLFVFRPR